MTWRPRLPMAVKPSSQPPAIATATPSASRAGRALWPPARGRRALLRVELLLRPRMGGAVYGEHEAAARHFTGNRRPVPPRGQGTIDRLVPVLGESTIQCRLSRSCPSSRARADAPSLSAPATKSLTRSLRRRRSPKSSSTRPHRCQRNGTARDGEQGLQRAHVPRAASSCGLHSYCCTKIMPSSVHGHPPLANC
jgi:hypothetical protein